MSKQPSTNCPHCGGFDDFYDQTGLEHDGIAYNAYFECGHCGATWTEVYKFTHIEETN